MTVTDLHGNVLTGATNASADLYNEAIGAFNIYRGDPVGLLDRAIADVPAFAMAHIMKAYLFALATEPEATLTAASILSKVSTFKPSEREASHASVIGMILNGEWTDAALALEMHNVLYPYDMLGIQCGHLVDFYRASARGLRDRMARVVPLWRPHIAGYSILLGMHAFGLEEMGDYARAEEAGRTALERNPMDSWAHHAVAHVMEMQGRAQDGIGWMIAREPYWTGEDNFFKVHNWWHRALCHLDLGQTRDVLALYDGPIRSGKSAVALDMVDASALLWRLTLTGHDVGDRWGELAAAWDQHADGRTYPFNDWHAVMAYLGAGRQDRVQQLLNAFRNEAGETTRWYGQSALPLVEGFEAFWRADYETAVDRLFGARHIANSFGGSHAQRDIIDWTLTEAALRGGNKSLSEALANERIALKPHSPVNRQFLARAGNLSASKRKAA